MTVLKQIGPYLLTALLGAAATYGILPAAPICPECPAEPAVEAPAPAAPGVEPEAPLVE